MTAVEDAPLELKRLRRPKGQRWLCGPVPMTWLRQARKLSYPTLWTGLILWHLAGLKKRASFPFSNIEAALWGINRQTKYKTLAALEEAGLIDVKREGHRAPIVTLLEAKPGEDDDFLAWL